jgi:hypothetical protein
VQDALTVIEGYDKHALDVAAAAHAVFDGSRAATRADLLISTIVESLATGPRTDDELLAAVQDAWPAAGITRADLDEALAAARTGQQQLLARTETLAGAGWTLDAAGAAEAAAAASWSADLRRRFAAEVARLAARDFRTCTGQEAEAWADRLTRSLGEGISAAEDAYIGAVELGAQVTLRPASFDPHQVLQRVGRDVAEDVAEFLRAAVLAAFDPADPFGCEVVSALSTGCVLHAYLARLDVAEQQRTLGLLAGQRVIVDTPLLLRLLGGGDAENIERLLLTAREAGVGVVVVVHYLEELNDLVDSMAETVRTSAAELADPERRRAIAALEDTDVLTTYVQAVEAGLVRGWDDFERRVRELPARLRGLGAEVRPHGNTDHEQVDSCRKALREVLADSGRGRSARAIDRDAETLSMALRHRRRHRRENPQVQWPGLFVLTTDTRLSPAYRTLDTSSDLPLALRPEQFALLLARVRPVPEARELAAVAASLLTRGIADRVTMRYPPQVAVELASSLAGTDLRVAQLAPFHETVERANAQDVVSAVLRQRALRTRDASAHQSERSHAERRDAARAEEDLRRQLAETADRARAAESRAVSEQTAREQAEAERDNPAPRTQHMRRAQARVLVAVALIALGIALGWRGSLVAALMMLASAVALWLQMGKWQRDLSVRLRDDAISIAANTAAVLAVLLSWVRG